VPTPHGLIHVEVDSGTVHIDSPVPIRFVDQNSDEHDAPAGKHEFTLQCVPREQNA
jgi:hypothetical protein